MEEYKCLINRANGVELLEERTHHLDVVRTSLWSVINFLTVVERLHTIALAGGGSKASADRHLDAAVSARLTKLRVYAAAVPAVELLNAMDVHGSEARTALAPYGEDACELFDIFQRIPGGGSREHLLGLLDHVALAGASRWQLHSFRKPPNAAEWLTRFPEKVRDLGVADGSATPRALVLSLGLYWLRRPRETLDVLRSCTPVRLALSLPAAALDAMLSRTTVEASFTLPALRTYLHDGTRVHVDPLAVLSSSSRALGHPGLEEVVSGDLRAVRIKAFGLLIRHICAFAPLERGEDEPPNIDRETMASRMERFLARWALLNRGGHKGLRSTSIKYAKKCTIRWSIGGSTVTTPFNLADVVGTIHRLVDDDPHPNGEAFRYLDAYYMHGL